MPGYTGFQLTLDLARLFPKELAVEGFTKFLDFARDLQKSGSDIVVEEDLANIFGRGRVSAALEKEFKAQVQIQKYTPLSHGSDVELVEGPGPTMLRGFRESRYFATVLTLSMLGYFHNRQKLVSMILRSMTLRFEANVPGATSNVGFDGILGMLTACSTQSANFQWSTYRVSVEEKLRLAIPNYRFANAYALLTPAVFLGAMDFLYIAQSLPEDRKITVSDQTGCIIVVIWAHYILELNVVITDTPNGQIAFGNAEEAQVYITWSQERNKAPTGHGPIIRLHEKNMSIILECQPQAEDQLLTSSEERHPLAGYGLTYLMRFFNKDTIIPDNDPVYQESVHLIAGLAVHASRRLDQDMDFMSKKLDHVNRSSRVAINIEAWRVLKSARLIFSGIDVISANVNTSANVLGRIKLEESSLPNLLAAFCKRAKPDGSQPFSLAPQLLHKISHLARVVLILAHIVELEQCADMPLILTNRLVYFEQAMSQISQGPDHRALVQPSEVFHGVTSLLSSSVLDHKELKEDARKSSRDSHFLFLCSDFGWSVFLDTVSDKDPARARPELIHVKRGTPTNKRTGERKNRIRDGLGFRENRYRGLPSVERGMEYVPRAVARVSRRTEYWTSQSQEFEKALHWSVDPSPEWRPNEDVESFDEVMGHRDMQNTLWQTYSTPSCSHPPVDIEQASNPGRAVKLGPDAAALLGVSDSPELIFSNIKERVLIYVTLGQRHIRWLAIRYSIEMRFADGGRREVMLRGDHCCEECAREHAASLPGKWILIL